jgi:hypothetical protein
MERQTRATRCALYSSNIHKPTFLEYLDMFKEMRESRMRGTTLSMRRRIVCIEDGNGTGIGMVRQLLASCLVQCLHAFATDCTSQPS